MRGCGEIGLGSRKSGQDHAENRAFTGDAFDFDHSMVRFDDPASEGQAEPRAALVAAAGLVCAKEAFKDMREVGVGDSDAGVPYFAHE